MDVDKLGIVGGTLLPSSGKGSGKKKVGKKKTSAVGFHSTMKKAEESELAASASLSDELTGLEQVEELLDEVYELGEELKSDASLATLEKYKKAVRHFYQFVVSRSLEAEQKEGRLNPRTMSRKQYTLIAVVDKRLESLGAAVLRNQRKQLEILQKVDEIYGILVDLSR